MTLYPGLARAALIIALDNGGINRDRSVERQAVEFQRWVGRYPTPDILPAIDAWLAGLSEDRIELVCAGGEGEPETVAAKADAPPFLDTVLNAYFDEVC